MKNIGFRGTQHFQTHPYVGLWSLAAWTADIDSKWSGPILSLNIPTRGCSMPCWRAPARSTFPLCKRHWTLDNKQAWFADAKGIPCDIISQCDNMRRWWALIRCYAGGNDMKHMKTQQRCRLHSFVPCSSSKCLQVCQGENESIWGNMSSASCLDSTYVLFIHVHTRSN